MPQADTHSLPRTLQSQKFTSSIVPPNSNTQSTIIPPAQSGLLKPQPVTVKTHSSPVIPSTSSSEKKQIKTSNKNAPSRQAILKQPPQRQPQAPAPAVKSPPRRERIASTGLFVNMDNR